MSPNKALETSFALVGAVLWAIQPLPQLIKSYRSKSTAGVSAHLMGIWALSGLLFCVYVVVQHLAVPALVQPHICMVLYILLWGQSLYYQYKWARIRVCLAVFIGVVLAGIAEAVSVITLLIARRHGNLIPVEVYGYLSTALCVLGLIPQYYEICLRREVVGLSTTFVIVDLMGAAFYIAALFCRPKLDRAGLAMYALTGGLVLGIALLALILNPIKARRDQVMARSTAASQAPEPDELEKSGQDLCVHSNPESDHTGSIAKESETDHQVAPLTYFKDATHLV
ncbi:hypothetical protein IAU60_002241 [Kwoniella sp. DSM 27419]